MELEREMRISVKQRLKSLVRTLRLEFPNDLIAILNRQYSLQTIFLYYQICITNTIQFSITTNCLKELKVLY